jgi:hypothetical protein
MKMKNPFKLWGAYLGFVLGAYIPSWLVAINTPIVGRNFFWHFIYYPFFLIDTSWTFAEFLVYFVLTGIFGFLIGWGLHSGARGGK